MLGMKTRALNGFRRAFDNVTLRNFYSDTLRHVPRKDASSRFLAEWSTLGVVAALMASFCLDAYFGALSPEDARWPRWAASDDREKSLRLVSTVYGALCATAVGLHSITVLSSTILYICLNALADEDSVMYFLEGVVWMMGIPVLTFVLGVLVSVAAANLDVTCRLGWETGAVNLGCFSISVLLGVTMLRHVYVVVGEARSMMRT